MILVDYRDGADPTHKTSKELIQRIRALGVPAQEESLKYGDFAFSGNGPDSSIVFIGFERKTLSDMLNCIDDSRLSAHQKPGMGRMYDHSFLILEGMWKSDENGLLMEGFRQGYSWVWKKIRGRPVEYSKLYRYLISLSLSGMCITYSQDIAGTARNVVEHYKYFQKKWTEHKSMLEMQKLNLPCIDGRPSLARQWAAALTGIGPDLSERAAKHFGSGLALAVADESDWTEINGIARPTARKVIKEIEEVTGR